MEIKYELKGADNVGSPFTGHVMIKLPTYLERIKLLKGMNLKNGEDGATFGGIDNLDAIEKLVEIAEKQVASVDLTHTESGEKFSSLEALGMYEEGVSAISEIGSVVIRGLKLGKS